VSDVGEEVVVDKLEGLVLSIALAAASKDSVMQTDGGTT